MMGLEPSQEKTRQGKTPTFAHQVTFNSSPSLFQDLLIRSYSCSDPNCSDSPLEYDNSRLSLDENCHILEENYTNLVSFFSNSRVRITHSLSTTTRITFL